MKIRVFNIFQTEVFLKRPHDPDEIADCSRQTAQLQRDYFLWRHSMKQHACLVDSCTFATFHPNEQTSEHITKLTKVIQANFKMKPSRSWRPFCVNQDASQVQPASPTSTPRDWEVLRHWRIWQEVPGQCFSSRHCRSCLLRDLYPFKLFWYSLSQWQESVLHGPTVHVSQWDHEFSWFKEWPSTECGQYGQLCWLQNGARSSSQNSLLLSLLRSQSSANMNFPGSVTSTALFHSSPKPSKKFQRWVYRAYSAFSRSWEFCLLLGYMYLTLNNEQKQSLR